MPVHHQAPANYHEERRDLMPVHHQAPANYHEERKDLMPVHHQAPPGYHEQRNDMMPVPKQEQAPLHHPPEGYHAQSERQSYAFYPGEAAPVELEANPVDAAARHSTRGPPLAQDAAPANHRDEERSFVVVHRPPTDYRKSMSFATADDEKILELEAEHQKLQARWGKAKAKADRRMARERLDAARAAEDALRALAALEAPQPSPAAALAPSPPPAETNKEKSRVCSALRYSLYLEKELTIAKDEASVASRRSEEGSFVAEAEVQTDDLAGRDEAAAEAEEAGDDDDDDDGLDEEDRAFLRMSIGDSLRKMDKSRELNDLRRKLGEMTAARDAAVAEGDELRRELAEAHSDLMDLRDRPLFSPVHLESAGETTDLRHRLSSTRQELEDARRESAAGLSRAQACVEVLEDAVGSAMCLHTFSGLDPALKVKLELAAAREHLNEDNEGSRYCELTDGIQADFSLSLDDPDFSVLETVTQDRDGASREIKRLELARDAAAATATAALRLVEFYSSRATSPSKARRDRGGDEIFSDAYGMQRLRSSSKLPSIESRPPSQASRSATPHRPNTKHSKRTNPLREFKLSSSARRYPRNPNPRSPPLPYVMAF